MTSCGCAGNLHKLEFSTMFSISSHNTDLIILWIVFLSLIKLTETCTDMDLLCLVLRVFRFFFTDLKLTYNL